MHIALSHGWKWGENANRNYVACVEVLMATKLNKILSD
jgi:hypothetical protein